jgi:hypothetical protein
VGANVAEDMIDGRKTFKDSVIDNAMTEVNNIVTGNGTTTTTTKRRRQQSTNDNFDNKRARGRGRGGRGGRQR